MKPEPRIRIDDVNKIRILVCHLIYSLGCPLNRDQLAEITSLEQAVNYFDLMEALEGITARLCTCTEINGIPVYANTKLGDAAAREFGNELPQSVREKMFEEAVKVYTRDEIKKDGLVSVRYAERENGTCTIGVTIKSQKSGRQKYYLTISAEDKPEADRIKKRIQHSPEDFRRYLESYFEEE
ncbi:MAG: DUF4364 family protein [Oscillospiraceae bacterium]|nr:DUF4364 family protein [Oscillospiraceae bacterium]